MGDRANIVVVQNHGKHEPPGTIFFYSHWGGHDLPTVLRTALLRGKSRWDDEPYLARIIFCEMVRNDDGLTGFGISDTITDNSYPLLVVDCQTQTVGASKPETPLATRKRVSFDVYVALGDDACLAFRESP